MQLHELQPIHKPQSAKRIGRGGKRGKYSGRGVKGQNSRAGTRKQAPRVQDIFKRYHKLRGVQFKSIDKHILVLNIKDIESNFKEGETVNPQILIDKGMIKPRNNQASIVKILGVGRLTKKINIEGCELSKTAEEKIKKLGGLIK